MKKVFMVRRTDSIDWDEYDSCVMVADSKEEIEEILSKKGCNHKFENGNWVQYWDRGNREIEEIDLEKCCTMELVASFNAG